MQQEATPEHKKRGPKGRPFVGDGMKVCALCKLPLLVVLFSDDRSRTDGFSPRCKKCIQLSNKRYLKCEGCGGLRSASGGQRCIACYIKKTGSSALRDTRPDAIREIKWLDSWKDKERPLWKILRPPKLNGKNCANCGAWFTFKGKPTKRSACGSGCARAIGRELARSQSKLPYDFGLLYDLYWNQGLSTNQIAKHYGIASNGKFKGGAAVHTRLRILGVPTRSKGKKFNRTTCIIDGCNEPIFKIQHRQYGLYGIRCLEHYTAHRLKLRQDYWNNKIRWQSLGLGRNASPQTLTEQIDRVVSKSLPQEVRSEVCQELAVKIMTREVAVKDLPTAARECIRAAFNGEYQSKYGPLSLDAPLAIGEVKGMTLGETVV